MTEHAPDRVWSGIDIPKTVAGVLAAISAAVIGSFLGVAGTLAGAAIASVIGSVGTEVYHRFIHKGREKLQSSFTTAPAAVGTPAVAAAEEEKSPPDRHIRWKRIALVAGSLFVLAIGSLTVVELMAGKSIADATRGGSGDGSTISSLFTGDKSGDDEQTTPTPAESGSPADDGGATTEPTGNATTEPAQQATTEPNTEPTTEAPKGDTGTSTEAPAQDVPKADAPKADADPDNGTE